ncbi:MAG: hypothetical protein C4325_10160 [Blastocatellia bacterium]
MPGRPIQRGFIERFKRRYRQAILDMCIFESLNQVRELTSPVDRLLQPPPTP